MHVFAFVVFVLVFSTNPGDWPGKTSLRRPILCQVRCRTLTHLTRSVIFSYIALYVSLLSSLFIISVTAFVSIVLLGFWFPMYALEVDSLHPIYGTPQNT